MRLEAAMRKKTQAANPDPVPPGVPTRIHEPTNETEADVKKGPQFDFDTVVDRTGTGSVKWYGCEERDTIGMWIADMDFQAPQPILDALHRHVDHGVFGYARPTEELVQTIVTWMRHEYDWQIDPAAIVWLPGLVPALNLACRAFANDGDEVLTFTPAYPPFLMAPGLSGRQLTTVPLSRADGRYVMDPERFAEAVTPQSSVFLLCNPHNPVGRRWDRREIERIAEICLANNIVICSDEIHCDLILDGAKHIPTAALNPDIAANAITLMAPSKTFNVPGLNCAFAIIENPRLRKAFCLARDGIVPNANALGYTACLAAYRDCRSWHEALIEYLRANKDFTYQYINERIPHLSMDNVQATYLAWIDAHELGIDPARHFQEAGVRLFDGKPFGAEGFVRLNFACPRATLTEALERMEAAVLQLKQ